MHTQDEFQIKIEIILYNTNKICKD